MTFNFEWQDGAVPHMSTAHSLYRLLGWLSQLTDPILSLHQRNSTKPCSIKWNHMNWVNLDLSLGEWLSPISPHFALRIPAPQVQVVQRLAEVVGGLHAVLSLLLQDLPGKIAKKAKARPRAIRWIVALIKSPSVSHIVLTPHRMCSFY